MIKKKDITILLSTVMLMGTLTVPQVTAKATGINGWQQNSTSWNYYINGNKATNWIQVSDKWYYINANGDMATGWIVYSGKSYYLNANGDMLVGSTTPDGYVVGADGAWNGQAKVIAKEPADIAAIRATCINDYSKSALYPVLVSNVTVGVAKITTASAGFTQAEVDKLNLGLSAGKQLYDYWLTTHDYGIFGDCSNFPAQNKWQNQMCASAEVLRASIVSTAETKAMAREYEFIAQEIINYQPYAIKGDGYSDYAKWLGANSRQSIGSLMATATFNHVTYHLEAKL